MSGDYLPFEQTDDVSPGSPLSVPLSCPSLSSESRQCNDKSLGPSDEDAGDGGERWPLCPARISVIMNLDLLRWWCGMVVATAADISCIVMGGPGLGPADSPLDKVTPANVKQNQSSFNFINIFCLYFIVLFHYFTFVYKI